MIDTATISDYNLALYVDEYIKRAMIAAHTVDEDGRAEYCHIAIHANCSSLDEAYEIKHEVHCGWGASVKITGNNAIRDAAKAMQRYVDDKREHQPTKVTPMLAAPVNNDHIEEAEFVPFNDDVRPF